MNYAVFELYGGRKVASDNFTDIDKPDFEPHFLKFVRPAFSPVGLMLDVWDQSLEPGRGYQAHIYLVNDLVAEIAYKGERVRSVRKINILPGSGSPAP